jgi:hypothetical protein
MRERERLMRRARQAVRQRTGNLRRDVLHQRAAAGDVEHLDAAADGEHRQPPRARGGDQGNLELIAFALGFDDGLMRRLAVPRRRHVVAAGEDEPADPGECVVDRRRHVEDRRRPADVQDRLLVVLELPAMSDTDGGHKRWRRVRRLYPRFRRPPVAAYMRAGTSIPIRSSARVSWART